MPGVDFESVRREITIEQVLNLLGFEPVQRSGMQGYGHCPLHESRSECRRIFSMNVALGRYSCHRCRSHGSPLELWATATKLRVHQAAVDLCQRLGRAIERIRRS
jgi:CHC2 zinc finger